MRSTTEAAARAQSQSERLAATTPQPSTSPQPSKATAAVLSHVLEWLDEAKAEQIVTIPLTGKSSIGDYMVIASGRSDRHVGAIGDQLYRKLKENGDRKSVV